MKNDVLSRITLLPGICGGKPTIRGMRIPVQVILEALAAGDGKQDILDGYSVLEEADIDACLAFAAKLSSFEVGESYLLSA
jgi:uncharacterized protein (DUF433 family)